MLKTNTSVWLLWAQSIIIEGKHIFCEPKKKNFSSTIPLNSSLNAFTFKLNDSAVFIQRFIVSNTDNNVLKYHLSSLQDQDNGKQRNLNSKQTSIPH